MTPKPSPSDGIPLNEPQTARKPDADWCDHGLSSHGQHGCEEPGCPCRMRGFSVRNPGAGHEREAQGIPLIDVELLARAYEMGWTHGRDGESPNPRAAIEGVARLASESSIPVEEGER